MTAAEYAEGVRCADRAVLGRALTLVESRKSEDRVVADELLQLLLSDGNESGMRVGISGAPGVGKSTFIEALGKRLIADGKRLAVLAVDPSSEVSGGSILGDKTRMPELARSPDALVRPTASGGDLGGVHSRTREAILLCEAAGFDVVIVETVGVGQSETQVASMTDCFVLLIGPGAGDHVQGIKRGIVELADLLVATKADGDSAGLAERTRHEYGHALEILRSDPGGWSPRVLSCSSFEDRGVADVWAAVVAHRRFLSSGDQLAQRRRTQRVRWFREAVDEQLRERILGDPETAQRLSKLIDQVAAGDLSPTAAAARLF
jgi:LAO/AO transport system kinase